MKGEEVLLGAAGFLILFVAFWLGITKLLHHLSGWDVLQRAYPDEPAHILHTMRFVSGAMGYLPMGGVQYGSCLKLEICATGLRVSVWPVFGLFSRPFLVPWRDIHVKPKRMLLFRGFRLGFGTPEMGQLTLSPGTTRQLESLSQGSFSVS